jgi:hypothetical protein
VVVNPISGEGKGEIYGARVTTFLAQSSVCEQYRCRCR